MIGRGTLNLQGAVLLDEPRDITVIALVEPKLTAGITISNVDFLRKEKAPAASTKLMYSYDVATSDGANYLVQLIFSTEKQQWVIEHFETPHA